MQPDQWIILTLVGAIAGAGLAQLWVFGWTFKDMKEDRDYWRGIALDALDVGDKAIDVAVEKVEKVATPRTRKR